MEGELDDGFFLPPSLPLQDGSSERLLHHHREGEGLGRVRPLAGHRHPPVLPHHPREHELDVEHPQGGGGADPPAGPERHHPDASRPRDVRLPPLAALLEPLRPPLPRVLPRARVLRHPRRVELHAGVRRDAVPAQLRLPRRRMRQHEVTRRVPPHCLLHHRLQVAHPLHVRLRDLPPLVPPDLSDDLLVQPLLRRLVEHQMQHRPLQHGGARVGAGAHDLRAESHQLVLAQPAFAAGFHAIQGVDVGLADRAHHLPRRARVHLPPALHERPSSSHQGHKTVHLPLPQLPGLCQLAAEEGSEDREEIRQLGRRHHHHLLEHLLDHPDVVLGDPGAEADADEDAADGEAAVAHHLHRAGGLELGADAGEVVGHSPVPDPAELLDASGGDDLADEVTAEGAPEGPVRGGVDGALAGAEEEAGGGVGGAAGEEGTPLHQRLVDEVGGGDDDEGPLPHPHGEDGAVALAQVPSDVHEGPPLQDHLEQVSHHRPPRRTGREPLRRPRTAAPPHGRHNGSADDVQDVDEVHMQKRCCCHPQCSNTTYQKLQQ
ncbi:unnamed protein product [Musa hybrid cultivar]